MGPRDLLIGARHGDEGPGSGAEAGLRPMMMSASKGTLSPVDTQISPRDGRGYQFGSPPSGPLHILHTFPWGGLRWPFWHSTARTIA